MYKKLILFFFILFSIETCKCENCLFQSTCKCVFNNGSVIDLTSLGSHNAPRFENFKAVVKHDDFLYSYNPCFPLKLGSSGSCSKGVAVCQHNNKTHKFYNCGDADSVNFLLEKNKLHLVYSASPRSTYVTLVCSEDAVEPKLVVNGETQKDRYDMILTSRCACPDLCQSHLSTGSVLVILFFIFVVLYLFFGIAHSSLTRGAKGWELLPHYEFWSDFPLLVRDGCVFVVSGCKLETGYERI